MRRLVELGDPVPVEAEPLGVLGQLDDVSQGCAALEPLVTDTRSRTDKIARTSFVSGCTVGGRELLVGLRRVDRCPRG